MTAGNTPTTIMPKIRYRVEESARSNPPHGAKHTLHRPSSQSWQQRCARSSPAASHRADEGQEHGALSTVQTSTQRNSWLGRIQRGQAVNTQWKIWSAQQRSMVAAFRVESERSIDDKRSKLDSRKIADIGLRGELVNEMHNPANTPIFQRAQSGEDMLRRCWRIGNSPWVRVESSPTASQLYVDPSARPLHETPYDATRLVEEDATAW